MKKILLPLGYSIFWLSSMGQDLQWATKVLEFSSQLTPVQYSAEQVLGKPNVLPAGGPSPNAWAPDRPGRKEFIKVGFEHPVNIRQIAIAESHNPSALFRVSVFDESGMEYQVTNLSPQSVPLKGRMLNIFVDATPYKVAAVKLEFDGAAVPDYFAIDAIAITDSRYPIIADIPKPLLLASGIVIEQLDENINSDFEELNPLLSPDGKTLYFSRRNHPENVGGDKDAEDIWYSELDSTGHWQLAKNLSTLNTAGPNFINTISSVSPDGKSAIVLLGNKYLENGKMLAGVSMSTRVNGEWSKPVALEIKNDYNFSDHANYFLADDRKKLVMSVEREDSQGDRDLYVSFFEGSDSTWTEPLNLGTVVNTAGVEQAPFLANDGKTLYFSSDGFSGYGRNDIYVTKRLDDTWTNWSEPENLGPEINSPLEDLFFNVPASSDYAYYSRGVTETNTDIFRVKLPFMKAPEIWVNVKGKVVDANTNEPLGAKVVYETLPDGKEVGVAQSDPSTGEFGIRLLGGKMYGVRADAKDKISESQNLDLRNVKGDVTVNENFNLAPIKLASIAKDTKITLNNVFFEFDKAQLRTESFPELDRIVALLNENETVTIEIAGHTDSMGSDKYNMQLSKRRANAVTDYLKSKGLKSSRLKVAFFGETKPVESNDTEEGRAKNRRVEFKITKT